MLSTFHKIFDALTSAERGAFKWAAGLFCVSLVLTGTNAFYRSTRLAPAAGGSFTEGVVGQPIAVNPLIGAESEADRDLLEVSFADLTELMESHQVSDDGKTWTVKLKLGLRWSDGQPLVSDDVVFTITTIQNPDARSPLLTGWQGVTVDRVSEGEVRFSLKAPYAFFLDNLRTLKVAPQHIFGTIPAANVRLSAYNLEPVGSGPYAFAGLEKRRDGFITSYRLRANPYYAGDRALIQQFEFRFFERVGDAVAAFNRREINGLGGIGTAEVDALTISHQLHQLGIPRYYAVFFNLAINPALKEPKVRAALNLVTDREHLVEGALGGYGKTIAGPLYPGLEGYDPTFDQATSSVEGAEALLDAAGWKPGEGGIREKSIGKETARLSFELIVPDIDFLVRTADLLAQNWRRIGVEIKPVVMGTAEIASDVIRTRNYHLILFGNILRASPDIFSFWHSSERFRPGLNLSLYENKTIDTLLETVRTDFGPASRERNLKRIQTIIGDEHPAVFLFSPDYLYASPKNLGGFEDTVVASAANRFDHVNRWYLKTARVFR